ncbi:MAG: HlyD family efflux transporter periplasmic adaptor subunit [Bacteroidales bacterium]|jgi:HlyD family secretion protein|nr:HlyD family efflux transporter periplasmic adaptor subunit [Bacteroidales bacterium]
MKTKIYLLILPIVLASCSGNENGSDAYGNFEAKEVIVSAEALGKIIEFNAEEGESLVKGQFLGFIDTLVLSIQREQLLAQKNAVASKKANVNAQIDVQVEQKSIIETEKNRIEQLYKDNAATKQKYDDIKGKYVVLEKQIVVMQTQISSINKEMKVVDKQVKLLNEQINKTKIINPIDGTVLEKYLEENEIAMPGKALYKIAYLDEIELRVYVSGAQLPTIKIGQKVKVYIDKDVESNQEYAGEIFWISDQAEFTPKIIQTKEDRVNMVYAVKIRVKNDDKIKIGMPGEVEF